MKQFDEPQHRKSPDSPVDQHVTYEDIKRIVARRHNYDSIGDNDIM